MANPNAAVSAANPKRLVSGAARTAAEYSATTKPIAAAVQASYSGEFAQTGVFFLSPTLEKADIDNLRSGNRLGDKDDVFIRITGLTVDGKANQSFLLKVKFTDFTSDPNRVFFGDRPLTDPGYTAFALSGTVGAPVQGQPAPAMTSQRSLDVWRVEQRLKYLGFGAPTGATDRLQREYQVNGVFNETDARALKHFEKIIRFRNPNQTGSYNVVGNGNLVGALNGADGVVAPNDPVIIAGDLESGTSLDWLSAYNAPHWMNVGGQMQRQGDALQTSYSLANWQNSQIGVADNTSERYATSWMRDLMQAQSQANSTLAANRAATGSRFVGATDANILASGHLSHQLGMNFDLSITNYLGAHFMSSAAAVSAAISTANLPDPLPTAANGWAFSLANGQRLLAQLPNERVALTPNNVQNNKQKDALSNFLALYALTRSDAIDNNGTWDDINTVNGAAVRTALFGDGSRDGSMIARVIIGGTAAEGQATHPRLRETLTAMGVVNIPYRGHHHHFHVDLTPPRMVRIVTPPARLTTEWPLAEPRSIPIDAGNLIAKATPIGAKLTPTKYAGVFGGCQFMESSASSLNRFHPAAVSDQLLKVLPNDTNQVVVRVLSAPKHGTLRDLSANPLSEDRKYDNLGYIYQPDSKYFERTKSKDPENSYFGKDQAVFEVDYANKTYKIIYDFHVVPAIEYGSSDSRNLAKCNFLRGKDVWRISESGEESSSNGNLAAWQRAGELQAFLAAASDITLVYATLPAAAIGTTTGSGLAAQIQLDNDAAGHGWYVDAGSPLSLTLSHGGRGDEMNADYLPTSDPTVWKAKAGSAAAGRMDMLSVLLHEYGHALGLAHSADARDFMSATLTPGVRKLPSEAELALMARLVAELKGELVSQVKAELAQERLPLSRFAAAPQGGALGGALEVAQATHIDYLSAINPTLANGNFETGLNG